MYFAHIFPKQILNTWHHSLKEMGILKMDYLEVTILVDGGHGLFHRLSISWFVVMPTGIGNCNYDYTKLTGSGLSGCYGGWLVQCDQTLEYILDSCCR